MSAQKIKVLAPAKINLFLHILSKRPDGYHNIESLFAFADFGDWISVEKNDCLSLEIDGPFSNGLEIRDNLVLRAAKALQTFSNISKGAQIRLEKNLPIASGIGGGSSDAAATLKALIRLWDIPISDHDLMALALKLGADIPACVHGTPQFVTGIGENLEPIHGLKELNCIFVNPNINVSTPDVFRKFDGNFTASISQLKNNRVLDFIAHRNDLQKPAIELFPEIRETLGLMAEQDGCLLTRMSGSGATCFGVFESRSQSKIAAKRIKSKKSTHWVKVGKILS